MIYITGDTHRDVDNKKLDIINFPIQQYLSKQDYVIVVGDMGVVWGDDDKEIQDFYNSKNFTTLFVDGNHENFDKLNSYEVINFNGGKAHKISDNIIHLMRGQIFEINGYKVFTMGGANSIDFMFRRKGVSWWPQELPSDDEYKEAFTNLEKHNYEVDLVLTHSAPQSLLKEINPKIQGNKLNETLEVIKNRLDYKLWFLGHYHIDKTLSDNVRVLYHDIVSIDRNFNIERYEGKDNE